jgi:hypothetical protein
MEFENSSERVMLGSHMLQEIVVPREGCSLRLALGLKAVERFPGKNTGMAGSLVSLQVCFEPKSRLLTILRRALEFAEMLALLVSPKQVRFFKSQATVRTGMRSFWKTFRNVWLRKRRSRSVS